jgi:hypothetical protein
VGFRASDEYDENRNPLSRLEIDLSSLTFQNVIVQLSFSPVLIFSAGMVYALLITNLTSITNQVRGAVIKYNY